MRSKGSRFTLGVWGLKVCSLDVAFMSATVRKRPQPSATVRNRLQPFATVRNHSREGRMAAPMVSFAKGIALAYLRFAWQAWRFLALRRVL